MKKYFLSNDLKNLDKLTTYTPYGIVLGWASFSIDEFEYELLRTSLTYYYEVNKEISVFGFRSFGDPRLEIKVLSDEIEEQVEYDDELSLEEYQSVFSPKIKIPMTQKRYDCVVKAMKLVAKLVIENEFNLRYKEFISLTTELERTCWQYQLTDQDFSDTISEVKCLDSFQERVHQEKNAFDSKVKELYIESQIIKQKFYDCKTVKELNVLFEDLMGLPMHGEQAKEENRYITLDDGSIQRTEVIPGLKF